jgi:transglutaminase-like putative cysteine protease
MRTQGRSGGTRFSRTRAIAIFRPFCGILVALLGCAAPSLAFNPQIPDWAMSAANTQGSWGDAKAVVLLQDTLLTVQPDGKAVERDRMVVKIVRPEGRDYAAPGVGYSKDHKLLSFHVWSIGPDGHHYAMKDSEYVESGISGSGILYDDERVKMASPPGADPGGIIAWETTQQLPTYLSEADWRFQNAVPTAETSFEIDLPAGWHQYPVWFRHDPVTPTDLAPNHFRWEMDNLKGIDLAEVQLHPAWAALASRMSVHFSANPLPEGDALWAKIGTWYQGLAAPQSEGGTDISAEARSVAGDGDYMARLSKVADFMQQQIRYVGIEIGIGNLQPHAAEEVFRNRYGDCKDKATLMVSMLSAVGIRATWVAVDHRRGVIDPGTPSIFGDHVITAIEIPTGYDNPRLQAVVTTRTGIRYLIFDPTNQYVPIGEIPENEQGSYGLLVAGANSQVIQLPTLNPDMDTTDRTAKFKLSPDGTLSGEVTVRRSGASSWGLRENLSMASEKDQRKNLEQALQQSLSNFTLGTEKTDNVLVLDKPLQMQYQVTAPMYAKDAGSLLLVRPRVIGSDAFGLEDKPRVYPISFDGAGIWKDDFDVTIPAGYTVDDVPTAVNMDVGFASYHSEVKAESGVLHYHREYTVKKLTLPPSDYADLLKLEAAITTDENSDAVLKKQ